jgi:hypothetical protein
MTRIRPFRIAVISCLFAIALALPRPACAAEADAMAGDATVHEFPFTMPSRAVLRASAKKVFAHYFTPFPRSLDNADPKSDYYSSQYLMPEGENGKFAVMGGYLRDRPIPRKPVSGQNWELQDACWEISGAVCAGLDGFCIDLLDDEGPHWQRALNIVKAAHLVDPGFCIIPMPDMDGVLSAHPEKLVSMVRKLAQEPAVCRLPDGRLVLSPYNAQNRPVAWWIDQLAALKAAGIAVAFVPCMQNLDQHWSEFLPICTGLTEWGDRTVDAVLATPNHAQAAHVAGKVWMMPVSPQDMRPKECTAREAENTRLYRTMWEQAINQNADWVQVITWNDYSESTEIAPSCETGFAFYDLTAYYVAIFKTGHRPPVRRDAIYAVYRNQPTNAELTRQKTGCAFIPAGSERNRIEMLAFLTAPAVLSVSVGRDRADQPNPAGLQILSVPLESGTPRFAIYRQGKPVISLMGPWEIAPRVEYQDLLYHATSLIAAH